MKFRDYFQDQIMLLPPNVQEMIPSNHTSRAINLVVEQLDLTKLYDSYSEEGQPGYHPKLLIKILLYGYSIGIRSSRKLSQATESDVHFMYLSAMQRPDFRTISDFRKLKGQYIREYFVQILDLCRRMGVINLGHISLDGSKIKSCASKGSQQTKQQLESTEEYLEQKVKEMMDNSETTDALEDKQYGSSKRGDELPDELSDAEKMLKRIKKAKEEMEKDKLKKVSVSDTDSRLMKMSNGGYNMSYNTQISVDSHGQIILACDVVNDSNDYGQFERMYQQTVSNTNQKPKEVSADAGYCSGRALKYIGENQIDTYMPDGRMNKEVNERTSKEELVTYDRRNFSYDKSGDLYVCPEGKQMIFLKNSRRNGVNFRIYKGIGCHDCLKRNECISAQHLKESNCRQIQIYEIDDIRTAQRKKLLSRAGKKRYLKRQTTVEPVFAHIKQVMQFKEFLLRGLEKARTEFSLICICHNIKKLAPVLMKG